MSIFQVNMHLFLMRSYMSVHLIVYIRTPMHASSKRYEVSFTGMELPHTQVVASALSVSSCFTLG